MPPAEGHAGERRGKRTDNGPVRGRPRTRVLTHTHARTRKRTHTDVRAGTYMPSVSTSHLASLRRALIVVIERFCVLTRVATMQGKKVTRKATADDPIYGECKARVAEEPGCHRPEGTQPRAQPRPSQSRLNPRPALSPAASADLQPRILIVSTSNGTSR